MLKFLDFLDRYAIRIVLTAILILGIFLGCLYISSIKNDLVNLSKQITSAFVNQEEVQDRTTSLTFKGLLIIIEQLETLMQQQDYVIEQNRAANEQVKAAKDIKPTYLELKSHSVFIVGCAGNVDVAEKLSDFPIGEGGGCWSGSGAVIKVTDTETYILTNNHVTGKGEKDVVIYVENEQGKVKAEIIKQHAYVDAAVIKVPVKLAGKVEIPGIATANIQDDVYVVGHPLGVKYVYTEGVVAGYEGVSMLIQMPCIYGNSGSGVFDRDGNLVGLVFALEVYPGWLGIPEARITHSLVVDSVSIKAFLKDLNLYE